MTGAELEAGKRWVEHRFTELAAELGAIGKAVRDDRWRKLGARFKTLTHCMRYRVELEGRTKRGEIAFRDVDLEDAGAGETLARESVERQIRTLLSSVLQRDTDE